MMGKACADSSRARPIIAILEPGTSLEGSHVLPRWSSGPKTIITQRVLGTVMGHTSPNHNSKSES